VVVTLAESEAHLVAIGQQTLHSPFGELGRVVSDFLGQTCGRVQIEVLAPGLALHIPFRQNKYVHFLLSHGIVSVHCASDANCVAISKLPHPVFVANTGCNLVLAFNEGVSLLHLSESLTVLAMVNEVSRNACSFLHKLTSTIHGVVIEGLVLG